MQSFSVLEHQGYEDIIKFPFSRDLKENRFALTQTVYYSNPLETSKIGANVNNHAICEFGMPKFKIANVCTTDKKKGI